MTLAELINQDLESMEEYFKCLFKHAERDYDSPPQEKSIYFPFGVKHLILSDMACNIYSLVDYRLFSICKHKEILNSNAKKLESFRKNRSESDFQYYTRYLAEVFAVDLSAQHANFEILNDLRIVRNILIHSGGHYKPKPNLKNPEEIPGLSLNYSLVEVSEEFIWRSFGAAREFLQSAIKA